jgi:hypothetical protein
MLHFRQIVGDRRYCPERQTLLCSVCRHTPVRVFGAWASDAGIAERQTPCISVCRSRINDTVATDTGQRLSVEQRMRLSVFRRDELSMVCLSVATDAENFAKYAFVA